MFSCRFCGLSNASRLVRIIIRWGRVSGVVFCFGGLGVFGLVFLSWVVFYSG